jgi:hypothetical protein
MMVHSEDHIVHQFLSEHKNVRPDEASQTDAAKGKFKLVLDKEKEIAKLETKMASLTGKEKGKMRNKIVTQNRDHAKRLLVFSKSLSNLTIEGNLVEKTNATWTVSGGLPQKMVAKVSYLPGKETGSPPISDPHSPKGWPHVLAVDTSATDTIPKNWVRAHLLSEKMHGPGTAKNLVPAHKTMNAQMETKAESEAKAFIKKPGNMLFYKVEVNYFSSKEPVSYFPSSLRIDWYELEKTNGKLEKKKTQKVTGSVTIQGKKPETQGATSVSLDNGGATQLMTIAKLPHDLAAFIVAARADGPFVNERRFENRMIEYYAENRPNVDFENKYWNPYLQPKIDDNTLIFG